MGGCESKEKNVASPPPLGSTQIVLSVYNLQRRAPNMTTVNQKLGFGFYHTGVCVLGYEWAFGGNPAAAENQTGIFATYPRSILPSFQFQEAIVLGYLPASAKSHDIAQILDELRPAWLAKSYHLLSHNCNHFSEAFVNALQKKFGPCVTQGVDGEFPAYVNRAARFADVFVPDAIYRSMMARVPQPTPDGPSSPASPQQGQQSGAAAPPPTPPTTPAIPIATASEMQTMSVKEIKTMMWVNGISWEGCIEKSDLVDAVERFKAATGGSGAP